MARVFLKRFVASRDFNIMLSIQNNFLLPRLSCEMAKSVRYFARGSDRRDPPDDDSPFKNLPEEDSSGLNSTEKLLENAVVGKASDFQSPDHLWTSNPYKEDPFSETKRKQGERAVRPPNVDPQDTSILLFPGQGSQYVGMGKDLLKFPLVEDLFDAANEVLGYDLKKICLEGPQEKLDQTKYCQAATVVCSLAAVEKLKEERPQAIESCVATAGFSVGEITALVFAGALPYEQAIRLVKVRGEAMQLASEMTSSGMATVMYGPDSKLGYACLQAKEYCSSHGIETPECTIANYLYPHCKVIAGHEMALDYLQKNASKYKLRRVRRLPVSGAFHTELMRPAVEPFRAALKRAHISEPLVWVHSNVDAAKYQNVDQIKRQLPRQMCRPVRWEQTMHVLYERSQGQNFPRTFECGPGKSLKTILKMVNAKAWDSTRSIEA